MSKSRKNSCAGGTMTPYNEAGVGGLTAAVELDDPVGVPRTQGRQ